MWVLSYQYFNIFLPINFIEIKLKYHILYHVLGHIDFSQLIQNLVQTQPVFIYSRSSYTAGFHKHVPGKSEFDVSSLKNHKNISYLEETFRKNCLNWLPTFSYGIKQISPSTSTPSNCSSFFKNLSYPNLNVSWLLIYASQGHRNPWILQTFHPL